MRVASLRTLPGDRTTLPPVFRDSFNAPKFCNKFPTRSGMPPHRIDAILKFPAARGRPIQCNANVPGKKSRRSRHGDAEKSFFVRAKTVSNRSTAPLSSFGQLNSRRKNDRESWRSAKQSFPPRSVAFVLMKRGPGLMATPLPIPANCLLSLLKKKFRALTISCSFAPSQRDVNFAGHIVRRASRIVAKFPCLVDLSVQTSFRFSSFLFWAS